MAEHKHAISSGKQLSLNQHYGITGRHGNRWQPPTLHLVLTVLPDIAITPINGMQIFPD